MNIFVLHPSPRVAAEMHCDQHIHKMILESAQMLSTMAHVLPEFEHIRKHVYKPTHVNHPCSQWVRANSHSTKWVIDLCYEMDDIRIGLGRPSHASMEVIQVMRDNLIIPQSTSPVDFIYCGDDVIGTTVFDKYHAFYIRKYWAWLSTPTPMSYNNRPLPDFLKPYASSIVHKAT